MAIDSKTAMRQFLLAQSSLTAIVGNRIFLAPIPSGTTYPCLEFRRLGGPGRTNIAAEVYPLFEFRCYGGNITQSDASEKAENLYLTLEEVLYQASLYRKEIPAVTISAVTYGPYNIKGTDELEHGSDYVDLDSQTHYVRCAWRVRITQ